ncbi:MAG TPA: translation initiation factor [Polyangiales bacterium]
MAKPKPPIGDAPGAGLKHNPFAALAGHAAPAAAEPTTATPPAGAAPAASKDKSKSPGRVVLRRETKHRGGKAVIIVTGLDKLRGYDAAAITALAKQLKQALGCGGTVEEHDGAVEIVLQGDHPSKVAELLRARGFRVDGVTS